MSPEMTSHQRALLEGLHGLYLDDVLTDVALQTSEGDQIRCHRNVLAASSPYFRAMFTNPVRERDEQDIFLHDVSHASLRAIISFMYSGILDLTNENVQDIFMTATMLEMLHLIDICADRMIQELCIVNCVDVYNFASHFVCTKLRDRARTFILEHFSSIVEESSKINELGFDEFLDIVSCDSLSVEKEETVFDSLMAWVAFDESRKKFLPRLFREIRLTLLNGEFVKETVLRNRLIVDEPLCREQVSLYEMYIHDRNLDDSSRHCLEYPDLNTKPRLGMFNRTMLVFSGGAYGMDERSFTAFDPVSKKNYLSLKPHPTFDFKFKVDYYQLVTTTDNTTYFLGGIFYDNHHFEDAGAALPDVLVYNMKEVKWDKRAPMNVQRCCFSACCHNNGIFVTGGKPTYPRGSPTDSMELYDPDSDYWAHLSPLPVAIYNHASTVIKDAVFVFGGQDEDGEYLDTVFRYDIPRDTWTLVTTQMTKPRAQLSALSYRNKAYLIGGGTFHENILSVDIYNPDRNTWSFGADFPEERKISTAVIHDGSIFLCGGVRYYGLSGRRSRKVESKDLYRYDIEKQGWVKDAKLIQYGNPQSCTVAVLNTQYLQQSDYVSR